MMVFSGVASQCEERGIGIRRDELRDRRHLFRSRLDQIIDVGHPLVKLAREMDWAFLEKTFGEVYTGDPGQPPLPARLMAGLTILKYTHNLSDEVVCERWVENLFGGKTIHRIVF